MERLPITFVGNREFQADGTWMVLQDPPRVMDGTFHVAVSLFRTGQHVVRIKGPPWDGSSLLPSEYLPWEVQVDAVCPLGQLPLTAPAYLCGCAAGTQPSGLGFGGSTVTCQSCPVGQLKETNGNSQCYSCLEAVTRELGDVRFAAKRTVTAEEGASSLHECGCSSGFFLSHVDRANATVELSTACPPSTNIDFAERTAAFRPLCCNETLSPDCTSTTETLCIMKRCKTARLMELRESRIQLPNTSGICTSCSLKPNGLVMEGVDCEGGMHATEQLNIAPGYWRANELSEDVLPCKVPTACLGTGASRGLLDNVCGANRMGPFCDVCFANFYKSDAGNCTECTSVFAMFNPESARSWLPFVIMLGVVVAMLTTFIVGKVWNLLKEKPATPLVWERVDSKPAKKKGEIWNRRLKEALREKQGASPVHFSRSDWRGFLIRYEIDHQNYIKVPLGRSQDAVYYRPMEVADDEQRRRFLRLPHSWNARLILLSNLLLVRAMWSAYNILIKRPILWLYHLIMKTITKIQKSAGKVFKAAGKQKHKLKILLSMFQVMDGLQTSFNLLLPLSFLELLNNLNFLNFKLPLGCFFESTFHTELLYRTATPLLLELILLVVAMFAQSRIPPVELQERRKPRSKLMSDAAKRLINESALKDRMEASLASAVDPDPDPIEIPAPKSTRSSRLSSPRKSGGSPSPSPAAARPPSRLSSLRKSGGSPSPSPAAARPPALQLMRDDNGNDEPPESSPPPSPPSQSPQPPRLMRRSSTVLNAKAEAKALVFKEVTLMTSPRPSEFSHTCNWGC